MDAAYACLRSLDCNERGRVIAWAHACFIERPASYVLISHAQPTSATDEQAKDEGGPAPIGGHTEEEVSSEDHKNMEARGETRLGTTYEDEAPHEGQNLPEYSVTDEDELDYVDEKDSSFDPDHLDDTDELDDLDMSGEVDDLDEWDDANDLDDQDESDDFDELDERPDTPVDMDDLSSIFDALSPKSGIAKALLCAWWFETKEHVRTWTLWDITCILEDVGRQSKYLPTIIHLETNKEHPLIASQPSALVGQSTRYTLTDAGKTYVENMLAPIS